ncbi:MAG TPA: ASCH domain-containing protein [Candidatus Saccharimonadales bacterium]|nr:ASCH domain-containing protein [Candidatus Saccharimonadales bacterium]
MQVHHLQLAAKPFNAIQSGRKTIECRLYDQKRQAIQLGDELVFTNREDAAQTVRVKVTGLLRYASFADLFAGAAPEAFGGESTEGLLEQIRQFYPEAEEAQHGVLGIVIALA